MAQGRGRVTWPKPTRADLQKFCINEGWREVRSARGSAGTHHVTYELALPDGRILRTRVSRPPDRSTLGAAVWQHVLRDQLDVSESAFWRCVKDGAKPDRGAAEAPKEAISADIAYLLVHRVGLSETELAQLTKDEAIARLNRYWAEQH